MRSGFFTERIQVFAVKGTGGLDSATLAARTAAEKGCSCIGVFSGADLGDEYASVLCECAKVWFFRREQDGNRQIGSVTCESGKAVYTPVDEAASASDFLIAQLAKPAESPPPDRPESAVSKKAVIGCAVFLAIFLVAIGLIGSGVSSFRLSKPMSFGHEYIDTSPYSAQGEETDGGLWQSLMDTPTAGDGTDYTDDYYSNKPDGDYVYFPAMGEKYVGCACLIKYLGDETELTLPKKLGGLDVITVSLEAFEDNTTLRSVTVPEGYIDISNDAFKGCVALEKIVLPSTVTTIGQSAFYGCTSLKSITIPDGVEVIEGWTFEKCESLKKITIPDSVHTIMYNAFSGCSSLEEIVIPDSVTTIEQAAFSDCSSLRRATIGRGITELPTSLFSGCEKLTDITVSEELSIIGARVFIGCGFEKFDVPKGVTAIKGNAFGECPRLKRVSIPASVGEISPGAFRACPKLAAIEVSGDNGVYSSVDGVLFHSGEDRLLQYPAGRSGKYAVPDGTKIIASYAFSCDGDLTSVTFPDSVTLIGSCAFEKTGLKKVTLPNSVTEIGTDAFAGCKKLSSIHLAAKLGTIGVGALRECPALEKISVDKGNTSYKVYEGMLVETATGTLVTVGSRASGKLSIPEGIVTLGSYCAEGCDISSVVFPSTLQTVENFAFNRCEKLRNVTFGGGETTLEYRAFSDCTALESIDMPDSVTSVSMDVFSGCTSLADVRLSENLTSLDTGVFENCTALKSIVIPNSVTSIEFTFTGCTSLERVILSDNLEKIGYNAFKDCSALRELYFPSGLRFATGVFNSESLERIYYGGSWREWQRRLDVTNNYFELYDGVEIIYNSQRPEK